MLSQELINNLKNLKNFETQVEQIDFKGQIKVALVYPSPYNVGMSSLGFQTIYRRLNKLDNVSCERAFLPSREEIELYRKRKHSILTIESNTEINKFDIIAFSVSYEIEILGLIEELELSNIPPLSSEREEKYHPLVIAGGPLTFSNPLSLGPFVDSVLMGEGEDIIIDFIEKYKERSSKDSLLEQISDDFHYYVPHIHKNKLPSVAKADHESIPAYSQIITPNTELSNMFLIEPERGCSRGCTFCVMRRSTNNGMRIIDPDTIYQKIPEFVKKVGLVGAAVTDHPKIVNILEELVINQKKQIGVSSLRADRLTDRFVELLHLGGYKTLTVASDGPSERLRKTMEKRIKEKHILRAAELAKENKMRFLKLYMIIGIPGETLEDIDELIEFSLKLAKITKVALGLSPFVAKKNTPLDKQPFEGIKSIDKKIKLLQKKIGKHIDIRSTSAKWAWIEHQLSQGTYESGFAALDAYKNGGNFSAWKKAFAKYPSVN